MFPPNDQTAKSRHWFKKQKKKYKYIRLIITQTTSLCSLFYGLYVMKIRVMVLQSKYLLILLPIINYNNSISGLPWSKPYVDCSKDLFLTRMGILNQLNAEGKMQTRLDQWASASRPAGRWRLADYSSFLWLSNYL